MEIKREAQEVVSFHLDAGGDPWLQEQLVLPSSHTKLESFSLGSHSLKTETGAVSGRCFGLSASVREFLLPRFTLNLMPSSEASSSDEIWAGSSLFLMLFARASSGL